MNSFQVKLNFNRISLWFFVVSVFMLTNGNLFNFLFKYTPLFIWRQIIFAIGLIIVFKYLRKGIPNKTASIYKSYGFFLLIIIHFVIFTWIFKNFSIVRLGFGLWIYFSGLPFLLFPYVYRQFSNNKTSNTTGFYNIFIWLGCFSTFGILLDYTLGGAITKFFFLFSEDLVDYSFENIGRYYFLTESPTSFGLYFAFCFACVLYKTYLSNGSIKKLIWIIVALCFLFASWLTGSRQIVMALSIELLLSGAYYICKTRDNKRFLLYLTLFGIVLLPSLIIHITSSNEGLSSRYDTSSIEQDDRGEKWERGLNETCGELDVLFFGKGFSYTVLNNVKPGEEIGYHYENTFFARISETGILGLFVMVYPIILIVTKCLTRLNLLKVLILSFVIAFVLVSFISPNGTHQTSQMILFIVLGICMNFNYYNIDKQSLWKDIH